VTPRAGVTVEVSSRPDAAALANRSLLEQALVNLAGNAARFTERGAITFSAEQHDHSVEVVVADTGPGIPPEVRARLFERFVRGPGADGGFGLGLAIAREAVEATGGTLAVDTSDQGGTRAVVRLPAARLVETL
jgi:signal transduction histidine kinase